MKISFDSQLKQYRAMINEYLESVEFDSDDNIVARAMAYSIASGGKRIRPTIAIACADALDGDREMALAFGCAVEMIHTSTLIHDDLPCMDNDDLRRGKPSCHKKFGEAYAVLAGDALLIAAYDIIAKVEDEKKAMEFVKVLSEASGVRGVGGGQGYDIAAETTSADYDMLMKIHSGKTAALILAAARGGAIAGGERPDFFKEYALSLGLAFQIRDDILDFEGNEEKLGKRTGVDVANNKATFVTVLGMQSAKAALERETDRALESIQKLGDKGEFLRSLALHLRTRDN
ncbi:MAG: polyprenyl synthetase family protein [Clostridia bacterium]|nr:polyprenyl synthetase family protein [Clostridia bacterium]